MSLPTVTVKLDGAPIEDITISGATIRRGRQQITEQPGPNTLSLTVLTPAAPWPYYVGALIEIQANSSTRFKGTITDLQASRYTTRIVAVSDGLGRLARLRVPSITLEYTEIGRNIDQVLTFVEEPLDDISIEPIFGILSMSSGAGGVVTLPPLPSNIDTGTVDVLPGQQVSGNTLAACQTIAKWEPFGVFWETGNSEIRFYDSERRSDITPDITIQPEQVISDWVASQAVDSIINIASITYDNPQKKIAAYNLDSVNQYGVYSFSQTIPLSNDIQAETLANRLVANGNEPRFITDDLRIDIASEAFNNTATAAVLALDVNSVVDVSPISIPGLPTRMYLEGWTETISAASYRFNMNLSDIRLTRPPQQWEDVPPLLTWAGTDPTLSWSDVILDYLEI